MTDPSGKPATLMTKPKQGLYPDLIQRESPNAGGPFQAPPDALVIHYTAGASADGAITTFMNPRKKVSAHVVVDRRGAIYQCVRLTREAWHAGDSAWPERHGQQGGNHWSIGIELVNWGLLEGAPGHWRAWTGALIPDSQVEVVGGRGWHTWPAEQLAAAEGICRRLRRDMPGIDLVLGHDEIAPTRKSDPGQAYPLNGLRRALGLPPIGNRR